MIRRLWGFHVFRFRELWEIEGEIVSLSFCPGMAEFPYCTAKLVQMFTCTNLVIHQRARTSRWRAEIQNLLSEKTQKRDWCCGNEGYDDIQKVTSFNKLIFLSLMIHNKSLSFILILSPIWPTTKSRSANTTTHYVQTGEELELWVLEIVATSEIYWCCYWQRTVRCTDSLLSLVKITVAHLQAILMMRACLVQ